MFLTLEENRKLFKYLFARRKQIDMSIKFALILKLDEYERSYSTKLIINRLLIRLREPPPPPAHAVLQYMVQYGTVVLCHAVTADRVQITVPTVPPATGATATVAGTDRGLSVIHS